MLNAAPNPRLIAPLPPGREGNLADDMEGDGPAPPWGRRTVTGRRADVSTGGAHGGGAQGDLAVTVG